MANEIKWADGTPVNSYSTILWSYGMVYQFYYIQQVTTTASVFGSIDTLGRRFVA